VHIFWLLQALSLYKIMRWRNIVISVFVAFCLFVYLFFRTESTIVNKLAILLINEENFAALRLWVRELIHLPHVVIYSLPEGLWVFCLTLFARNVKLSVFRFSFDCSVLPLIYAIVLELLQWLAITNGTFDSMDLVFAISFWLIAHNIKTPQLHQLPLSFYNTRSKVLLFSFSLILLSDVWT
jgi:hypothetical protein